MPPPLPRSGLCWLLDLTLRISASLINACSYVGSHLYSLSNVSYSRMLGWSMNMTRTFSSSHNHVTSQVIRQSSNYDEEAMYTVSNLDYKCVSQLLPRIVSHCHIIILLDWIALMVLGHIFS